MLTVQEASSRQADVAALPRLSDAVAASLFPNAYRRPLNPETLAAPGISVFVARAEHRVAAGCRALFDGGDGTAELKRMIVDARFRRRGVGRALLLAVETAALRKQIDRIMMEVGIRNADGQALYRGAGFRERGPFGACSASPISLFFEKVLGGER